MAKKRHSEEEIIGILREAESGVSTAEICRKHSIADATFYKWRRQYGGMEKSEARRLKDLEKENDELKKALGAHVIVIQAMKEQLKKRGWD